MSVSIHSETGETSKDEIETEEVELEDIVWNLMSRSGLLSQIQGQISKFIEDNGKAERVDVIPDRADARLLGLIFEYLQWVGMKQTSSVLLSESPVEVDLSIYEARDVTDSGYKPELYRLFEDHNETEDEDKASPTRSHNYSRDEFEDSKLTSGSGHPSVKSTPEDGEVHISDHEGVNQKEEHDDPISLVETLSSPIQFMKTDPNANPIEQNSSEKLNADEPSFTSTPNKSENNSFEKENGEMLINFHSPAVRGVDHPRPHVTLRQKLDLNPIPDPFQSPVGLTNPGGRLSMGASFPPNVARQSFAETTKSLDEILREDRASSEEEQVYVNDASVSKAHDSSDDKGSIQNETQEGTEDKNALQEKRTEKGEIQKESRESPDELSTSDFMETLSIEEDTQDVSILSDSKGMSSCEHVVSFK